MPTNNSYLKENQATNTSSGLNVASTTFYQHIESTPRQNINMSHIVNDPHASDSTQNSRSRGIYFWNEYAKKNENVPEFDKIRPTHQLKPLANGFIDFLLKLKKEKDGEYYAYGSLPTYFSGWKNALLHENCFQDASGFTLNKISSDFAGLHNKIKNKAFERAVNEGEIIHNADLFLRAGIMEELIIWILQNPRQNIHGYGWRDACILSFLRSAVGRGSEIESLKWNGSFFNLADEAFDAMWLQMKTAKVDRMRFVHDNRWGLSVLVMMGGYIATKSEEFRKVRNEAGKESVLIFDDLGKNVSNHVTNTILKHAKKKDSIADKKITSHCIRYGAIDDLISNELLETIAALVRGGWELGDFCTGFTYMDLLKFDLQAARVIAGQKDPFLKQAAPSLDFCEDEEVKTKLQNVANRLYLKLPFGKKEGDSLYSLKSVLLAAALENLEAMEAELGRDNQYLKEIECAFRLEAIYFTDAKTIGKQLSAKRRFANSKLREEKDFAYKTSKQLEKQGAKIDELTSLLQSSDKKIEKLQDMLEKVLHIFGNISFEKNPTLAPCSTDNIPCVNEILSESEVNSSQTSDGSGDTSDESVGVMVVEEEVTVEKHVQNVSREAHNFSFNANHTSHPKQVKLKPLSSSTKDKQLQNAFSVLGAGSCKAGAKKDFSDYHTLSIVEFVARVYTNECKLFLNGDNPLKITGKKNERSESCKFTKFLASFCENEKEYQDLTGDGRDMKKDCINLLYSHGKSLGELLQGRVNKWELPQELVSQNIKNAKCGRIAKRFIKKSLESEDFHCKIAHLKTWPQIKENMKKRFQDLQKQAAANAEQEHPNGEMN